MADSIITVLGLVAAALSLAALVTHAINYVLAPSASARLIPFHIFCMAASYMWFVARAVLVANGTRTDDLRAPTIVFLVLGIYGLGMILRVQFVRRKGWHR